MPKKFDPALRERAVRLVTEYPSMTAASRRWSASSAWVRCGCGGQHEIKRLKAEPKAA